MVRESKNKQVMRKFSLVLVAAMLLSAGNVFANNVDDADPAKSLSEQISQLLKRNSFEPDAVEMTAQVRFTLNQQQQIVVLSVDTENAELESFVKQRLNYRGVAFAGFEEGKLYTIPVRIVG